MKFVIARQDLLQLMQKAVNVVGQKPTIPILSNFMVEAQGQELILTATDLTVGVRCFASARVLEEGATTVPARSFSSLIKELTADHLEITVGSNDQMEIVADSSRFKILGMAKTEYPALPDLAGAAQFTVREGLLKDTLYRTSFAVSREDNRYVLTGVHMHVKDGVATFTGTDGKRLARSHFPIKADPGVSGTYIIPLKAVEELTKNLGDGEEDVTVYLMPDKIAVKGLNITLISKLLSGDYPDVSRVIPASSDTSVTLHREELMTLLRQVQLFAADSQRSVRFSFDGGELKLSANSSDVGEGKVSMPVNYTGSKFDVAFNPTFFLDILRHSRKESINLGLTDPYNPGVITDNCLDADEAEENSPLFVLMPMRIDDE